MSLEILRGIEVGSPLVSITTANSDATIYKRTTGRKFYLRTIIIANRSGVTATITLWDGPSADGRVKARFIVAESENPVITDGGLKGITWEYGDVVAQSDKVPVDIVVGGVEV